MYSFWLVIKIICISFPHYDIIVLNALKLRYFTSLPCSPFFRVFIGRVCCKPLVPGSRTCRFCLQRQCTFACMFSCQGTYVETQPSYKLYCNYEKNLLPLDSDDQPYCISPPATTITAIHPVFHKSLFHLVKPNTNSDLHL